MNYKGMTVLGYGSSFGDYDRVPTLEEFLDLAARVEELEKRLAKLSGLAAMHEADIAGHADPGDECDGCDDIITNLDQPVHIEPHKIIKGEFISNAGLEALMDQYRRQGVEAVAKWFEKNRFPGLGGYGEFVRTSADEILEGKEEES